MTNKFLLIAILALGVMCSGVGLAVAETPVELIETGKSAWSAFTAGKWALGLGLTLTLVIQLFRTRWLGGLVERIPKRWRVAIPLVLSGLASGALAFAGELSPELAALLAPVVASVSIGAHEFGESIRGKRQGYRAGRTGLISLALGCFLIGGCALRPVPPQTAMGPAASAASVTLSGDWCRARQSQRWWSSALAQTFGVLAGGLAAAALARDDDRIELGLEIGSLVSAGFAAGAQTFSGAQASAYENHCGGSGIGGAL